MENKDKIYDGVFSLEEAHEIDVLSSKSQKEHVRRPTIKEETYNRIVKWMGEYASRLVFDEKDEKFKITGKPVCPSDNELKEEFGMTPYALRLLAEKNENTAFVLNFKETVSKEEEETYVVAGLYKDVQYVLLRSLYPHFVIFLLENKPIIFK